MEETLAGQAVGIVDLVLSGFLRIVTHPRVFARPTPVAVALASANAIRSHPNATPLHPGARHWSIFEDLCSRTGARGNLIADAYLAALAIESESDWVTTDRDFHRFTGLRTRHPLDG